MSHLKNLFLTILTLVIIIIVLEIIFRILPTSDSEQTPKINKNNPYLHLVKNKKLLISSGTFFDFKATKKTNNFGYFSDINYEVNGSNKNLITIGSSLVTANQISNSLSYHGLINSKLPKGKSMYMLAGANAPQSQYLAYTKLALEKFNPYAFIIVIGNLDFRGSLIENSLPNSGYHYFFNNKNGSPLVLNEHNPSKIKVFLRNFATARYLFLNARVQNINFLSKPKIPTQESESDNLENDILMSRFLSDLQIITKNTPTLLVINNFGYLENNYLDIPTNIKQRKKNFILMARQYNFETIDLNSVFLSDFKINKKRFEWINDKGHWNADGHRVVADAIMNSYIYKKYVKN
jgi:hypothetical protein